jgi:nucleoside-diphosphate-sugar epimerase
MTANAKDKALVTGGGGFLGSAIVRRLRARGDAVRILTRGVYPELEALGVEAVRGDLADSEAVSRAVEGCGVVYHVAAKAGIWGPFADYHRSNVVGTRNVIAACRRAGADRLVFTSSPSVVFDGRDMEGVDESVPYPRHYDAAYPATKAEAERLVLAAGDATLATVALRPHLIWGPGDTNLVPRILARARAGRLRRIGRRPNLVDSIYIDDAAEAHLRAADRLAPGAPTAGRVYFLSQGEPWPIWDLVNRILRAAGLPPVSRTIPRPLAVLAGVACEVTACVLGLESEPPMTLFLARELSSAHWFNIDAARRDLGYEPSVTIEEGMRRLEQALRPAGKSG